LSEERPNDDKPIEAEVVEERSEEPVAAPEPLDAYRALRPREKRSAWPAVLFILGLAGVLVASVAFRKELTDIYDRIAAGLFGGPSPQAPVVADVPEQPEPPLEVASPQPAGEPTPEPPEPQETPLPHFEPREKPTLPTEPVTVIPPSERYPGLAYAVLDRKDLTFLGVYQYELKVLVPADYRKDDLLRMALSVVANERKNRLCYALRIYCFKDRQKTEPEDAFAEVIWAPHGDFLKAAEAKRAGAEDNEYRVIMKAPPAPAE